MKLKTQENNPQNKKNGIIQFDRMASVLRSAEAVKDFLLHFVTFETPV